MLSPNEAFFVIVFVFNACPEFSRIALIVQWIGRKLAELVM